MSFLADANECVDEHGSGPADEYVETQPLHWRYCLHIAYFGTGLVGWQRQIEKSRSGLGSVQELVEDAVAATLEAPTGTRINVTGASRTDAGTHALYQFATIKLSEKLEMALPDLQHSLNERLPVNVRVLRVFPLEQTAPFSRFRSKYKKYVYYIQQGHRPDLELGKYSWFLGKRIDVDRLQTALSFLVGEHDFRPFSQGMQKPELVDRSSVRTIVSARVRVKMNVKFSLDPHTCGRGDLVEDTSSLYSSHSAATSDTSFQSSESATKKRKVNHKGATPVHFICVELVANGFLRHMVRRIIGTARPIGEGTYPPTRMKQVLDGEVETGPSAPSKGLWLHRTWLTEEEWDTDSSKLE